MCGLLEKKTGVRKLYEHAIAQTCGYRVRTAEPDKISIQLLENPPETSQEWRILCAQTTQVVEAANHIAMQLE